MIRGLVGLGWENYERQKTDFEGAKYILKLSPIWAYQKMKIFLNYSINSSRPVPHTDLSLAMKQNLEGKTTAHCWIP